jgi:hypothetical protein
MSDKEGKEGMAKNLEVVLGELRAYGRVLEITWDRLRDSDERQFHVLAGVLPDTLRTLARTLSYGVYAGVIIKGLFELYVLLNP